MKQNKVLTKLSIIMTVIIVVFLGIVIWLLPIVK